MSPKRPISTQHTDLSLAKAKVETKSHAERARDTKRETGSERQGADDPSAAKGGGERVLADAARAGEAGSVASSSVASAAASVLGSNQAPKDVFDPTSKLDERAERAKGERDSLRDRARNGLQDDAARSDGTTGIAEQGTGGISEKPTGFGVSTAGGANVGADGEVTAKVKTDIANDPDFANNPLVDMAKSINTFTTRRTTEEADAANENAPAAPVPASEPTTTSTDTKGGTKFTHPDGSTTTEHRDGTSVAKDGSTTEITHPDGSRTTQATDKDGKTTVTERDSAGTVTSETQVGTPNPDEQNQLDPEKAALLGLDRFEEKLRGPGVAGGGHTDPVDDDGFGSGAVVAAPVVTGAAGNSLLGGGDGRAADVRSGGAGNVALDPGGNNGAIDPGRDADPGFGGGGLEDDPLDNGQGPSLGLDGGRAATNGGTDTAADEAAANGAADAPFRLIDPSQSRRAVTNFGFAVSTDDDTDDDGGSAKGAAADDPLN